MKSGRRSGRTTGNSYGDTLQLLARPLRYFDLGDPAGPAIARNHVAQAGSNGTYVNAEDADFRWPASVLTGPRRAAHDFDGVGERFSTSAALVNGLTRISMGAWITLDSLAASFVLMGCNHAVNRYCYLYIRATTGIVDVEMADGTTAISGTNDGTAVVVGRPTFVGVTWTGTQVKRYVNGVKVGTTDSWSGTALNDGGRPFFYGALNNAGVASNFLDGRMSHPFVTARALSDAEWMSLYVAGRSRHLGRPRAAA